MANAKEVQKSWGWFLALGILMIVGGACAIFAPFMFSIIVELIVGMFVLIGGIVMLIPIFGTDGDWKERLWYSILAGLHIIAGMLLIFRPLEGLMALTMLLIVSILLSGLLRIYVGFIARPAKGSGWVLIGGAVSVAVSVYLMTQYPEISVVLLGMFVGFSLIGEGIGYMQFAFGLKNATIRSA